MIQYNPGDKVHDAISDQPALIRSRSGRRMRYPNREYHITFADGQGAYRPARHLTLIERYRYASLEQVNEALLTLEKIADGY